MYIRNKNMKKKIILAGLHGRPSTKMAWANIKTNVDNPITLVQRRRIPNTSKQYYRVFGDSSLYKEEQLYQLKFKKFNFNNAVIIRWGTQEIIENMENTIVYNKASAIKNATDKYKSRRIFIEKGVNAPRLLNHPLEYRDDTVIIARPYNHSKGKNFVVLRNLKALEAHWREGWYYSEFVDKVREFRVHVGHGNILPL